MYIKVVKFPVKSFQVWRTTVNREISFEKILWWKTLFSKFLHVRKLRVVTLCKNKFVVFERKEEKTLVLRIAMVLLMFSSEGQGDRSERKHAILQNMDCARLLDGIGEDFGYFCHRRNTVDKMDYSMKKDENRGLSVGACMGWNH